MILDVRPCGSIKVKEMAKAKSVWDAEVSICDDDSTFVQNKLRFIQASTEECLTYSKKYNIKVSPSNLRQVIQGLVTVKRSAGVYHNSYIIEAACDGMPILINVACRGGDHGDNWDSAGYGYIGGRTERDSHEEATGTEKIVSYYIEATAQSGAIKAFFQAMDMLYTREHLPQVKWWYKDDHRPTYKTVFLSHLDTSLHKEFYPAIKEGPDKYLKNYLSSPAAVLLVAGPPGTGKTTLLRHLICDFNLAAHIVYDEELMKSDTVFQNFLFGDDSDILIVEDADLILTARERSDNKLMARFLSVADGLIKLPNKKLVFTTNIHDFAQIDQALLRPGRCFDLLMTGELDYNEAKAAAKVADLPAPLEQKDYTLAQLFNQGTAQVKLRTVGFLG